MLKAFILLRNLKDRGIEMFSDSVLIKVQNVCITLNENNSINLRFLSINCGRIYMYLLI